MVEFPKQLHAQVSIFAQNGMVLHPAPRQFGADKAKRQFNTHKIARIAKACTNRGRPVRTGPCPAVALVGQGRTKADGSMWQAKAACYANGCRTRRGCALRG